MTRTILDAPTRAEFAADRGVTVSCCSYWIGKFPTVFSRARFLTDRDQQALDICLEELGSHAKIRVETIRERFRVEGFMTPAQGSGTHTRTGPEVRDPTMWYVVRIHGKVREASGFRFRSEAENFREDLAILHPSASLLIIEAVSKSEAIDVAITKVHP